MTLVGSQLIGNLALNNAITSPAGFAGFVSGGGVWAGFNGAFTAVDDTLAFNAAVGGDGSGGSVQGGALFDFGEATLTLSGVNFIGNTAIGGSGSAGTSGSAGGEGGIRPRRRVVRRNGLRPDHHHRWIVCRQPGDRRRGGAGDIGAAGGTGGSAQGGGVYLAQGSTLTVTAVAITGNLALGGEGGEPGTGATGGAGGAGWGGGIYSDGTFTMIRGGVSNNLAIGGEGEDGGADGQGIGGGLYFDADGSATLTSVTVKHNHASASNDDIYGNYTSN